VAGGEDAGGPLDRDVPPPDAPREEPASAREPLGQSWARP